MEDPIFKCHLRIYADQEDSDYFICRHCHFCFHKNKLAEHTASVQNVTEFLDNERNLFYSLQRSEVTYYINRAKETQDYINKLRLLLLA